MLRWPALVAVGDRAFDTLDEAIVHLEQPLAGALADNFIAGLKRRAFAGDVRLRLTDSFAV